jgi:hypothetical protein
MENYADRKRGARMVNGNVGEMLMITYFLISATAL